MHPFTFNALHTHKTMLWTQTQLSPRAPCSKHKSHLLILAHSNVNMGTNPTNAFLQWMKEKWKMDIAESFLGMCAVKLLQ